LIFVNIFENDFDIPRRLSRYSLIIQQIFCKMKFVTSNLNSLYNDDLLIKNLTYCIICKN